MSIEKRTRAATMAGIMPRLVRRYLELSDACYRVSVSHHDAKGRFKKGHRRRSPHPALLKKTDLDRSLERIYERFFGAVEESNDTSTSNRRSQGSETENAGVSCAASPPRSWE
jgi:hypothetical protein